MIALLTQPERTTGAEICKAAINEFYFCQISKVVSVITDGAPSMTGEKAVFVSLFTNEVGHPVIGFHCIIGRHLPNDARFAAEATCGFRMGRWFEDIAHSCLVPDLLDC